MELSVLGAKVGKKDKKCRKARKSNRKRRDKSGKSDEKYTLFESIFLGYFAIFRNIS
jgi:hypothetical protein